MNIPLWQWALYGVGAVFLVGAWVVLKKAERGAVWVVSHPGGVAGVGAGLPVAGREEAGAVQSVPGESPARGDGQAACLCSAGASCVGPRGGVYCVSDAGSKRYLKGQ